MIDHLTKSAIIIMLMVHFLFSIATIDWLFRFGLLDWSMFGQPTPSVAIKLLCVHGVLIVFEYLSYKMVNDKNN